MDLGAYPRCWRCILSPSGRKGRNGTEVISSCTHGVPSTGGRVEDRTGPHSIEWSVCPPVLQKLSPSGNAALRGSCAGAASAGEDRPISPRLSAHPLLGRDVGGRDQPLRGAGLVLPAELDAAPENTGKYGARRPSWMLEGRPSGLARSPLFPVRKRASSPSPSTTSTDLAVDSQVPHAEELR